MTDGTRTVAWWTEGAWTGVVTSRAIMLLPPEVSEELVERLWWLLRSEDASLTQALDELVTGMGGRLGAVPDFVLAVRAADDMLHVALRGAAQLEVDGRRLDALSVTTWLETAFKAPRAVVASAPEHSTTPRRPVADAVVLAGTLTLGGEGDRGSGGSRGASGQAASSASEQEEDAESDPDPARFLRGSALGGDAGADRAAGAADALGAGLGASDAEEDLPEDEPEAPVGDVTPVAPAADESGVRLPVEEPARESAAVDAGAADAGEDAEAADAGEDAEAADSEAGAADAGGPAPDHPGSGDTPALVLGALDEDAPGVVTLPGTAGATGLGGASDPASGLAAGVSGAPGEDEGASLGAASAPLGADRAGRPGTEPEGRGTSPEEVPEAGPAQGDPPEDVADHEKAVARASTAFSGSRASRRARARRVSGRHSWEPTVVTGGSDLVGSSALLALPSDPRDQETSAQEASAQEASPQEAGGGEPLAAEEGPGAGDLAAAAGDHDGHTITSLPDDLSEELRAELISQGITLDDEPASGPGVGPGDDDVLLTVGDDVPVPSLPSASRGQEPPRVARAVQVAAHGDHDGHTVSGLPEDLVGELISLVGGTPDQSQPSAPSPSASPASPPTPVSSGASGPEALQVRVVLSAVCGNGHPNPTNYTVCRECGADLNRPAKSVACPPLGRLVTSSGEEIDLDRPVLVGRNPVPADVPSSSEVPVRVLTVPSPNQLVSRNHVLIDLDAWSVLAQDLGNCNGTVLNRAGEAPVRLASSSPVLLRSGDVLDVGDGQALTFENLP